MAIYHLSVKPISRSSGRSAVAAAAYRCAVRLRNERDGLVHDFTRKQGVEHAEIVLPDDISATWALDRSALWNAAEFAESRKDGRVAREFEVALPHELSVEGRLASMRNFAQDLANRYGAAVDFAIHAPHEQGDIRNYHAHVMMTTRQVGEAGLGVKTYLEHKNARLLSNGMATTDMQIRDIRQSWESIANSQLQREGLDIRIDHRSHVERGLELLPTGHMGVHATQMQRKGMDVERVRLDEESARRNTALIRERPEQVLTLITNEKSVFDRHDIAKTLHRYINDDVQTYRQALEAVMASPVLVALNAELVDRETGDVSRACYSTREMVKLEFEMARMADRLHRARRHGVDRGHVERAVARQDAAIRRASGHSSSGLSDEQRLAIEHVTGPERIAAVVGFAGAGKSTMLAAAREAWEAQGYCVYGAALSGKAAEGLEESSGIKSRTLASWSRSWDHDKHQIGRGDVFVIDEAGMVGSRQLARFISEAGQRGAKIVLVGDHEQLQAIGAGAPFRVIAERIGHAELTDIRRQRLDWQREASLAFATHRTADGLAAYRDHGHIHFAVSRDEVRSRIVRDYLADRARRPDGSRVAMAHRRLDVRAINEGIRCVLQERGELAKGKKGGELSFQTNDGLREFAPGDRIVFLENSRDLGVKNGMLGTVEHVEADRIIAQIDGPGGDSVSIPTGSYRSIDHGYATTIHKCQGATVDYAFVLASGTMDRHLTYVAMTRHRDGVELYADSQEFTNAGRLVDHGVAPYEHDPKARESYFVSLENNIGEQRTVWGVDLKRAMDVATPTIGDRIGLQHEGANPVTLPDGTQTERNSWRVVHGGELAYRQLEARLSRSGAKETTLDYVRDFAERRGIAERFGVNSEIVIGRKQSSLDHDKGIGHEKKAQPKVGQDRLVAEQNFDEERTPIDARPADTGDLTWDLGNDPQQHFAKPAPLVPALLHHDRSIEDVAREKAMSGFEQRFEAVKSFARHVFRNPDTVTDRLKAAVIEKEGIGRVIAKTMAEEPERFGELCGRTGLLGDNKERRVALHFAKVVAMHIASSSEGWEWRLGEERTSEQWQRAKRDVVEVPGLSPRSVEILAQVEKVPAEKRGQFIDELRSSADGQAALQEAKLVANALARRFGHSDPRHFAKELEQHAQLSKHAEQIKTIARMVERTRMAELTHDHSLKQQLNRPQGLGLSR
ncbi:Ti-type conjugative transfer relaxase TraA [Rhizobium rosettiformans]|uniref:Ti-type conjugative transfer relaxase TraA n=2 Tax=Rhizobium rosettiformans TaxID=1368430 RepID=A0A4S8PKU9_9HYPH|nr:Ti-type conjugative transfer relaxase TraA [Rhizobium rosettiformans]MBB5278662.1 Ti-type conjugative transfer relaxase TraA [Rhizobium rosettiformans]THV30325.1 Ti-type conjugative transfer relaxase TraA [Rhizobium rosettiformans W3]